MGDVVDFDRARAARQRARSRHPNSAPVTDHRGAALASPAVGNGCREGRWHPAVARSSTRGHLVRDLAGGRAVSVCGIATDTAGWRRAAPATRTCYRCDYAQ